MDPSIMRRVLSFLISSSIFLLLVVAITCSISFFLYINRKKKFNLLEEMKSDLKSTASDNKLVELRAEINERKSKVEILESRIAILENTVNLLAEKCANEQSSSFFANQ